MPCGAPWPSLGAAALPGLPWGVGAAFVFAVRAAVLVFEVVVVAEAVFAAVDVDDAVDDDAVELDAGTLVMEDQQLLLDAQGEVPACAYSSCAAASCTDAGAEAAVA